MAPAGHGHNMLWPCPAGVLVSKLS